MVSAWFPFNPTKKVGALKNRHTNVAFFLMAAGGLGSSIWGSQNGGHLVGGKDESTHLLG